MTGLAGTWQRPYDNQATRGQPVEALTYQMPKTALDTVPYDGVADGFAYDETRTRRGKLSPRTVRVLCAAQMDDERRAACPSPSSYRG